MLATTYCYSSVRTLSDNQGPTECFSVFRGKFTKVFPNGSATVLQRLEARTSHVIPGLWDGHGHLIQFGESLDSVSIFGAKSIEEVLRRLKEYKAARPEAGTKEQLLRGVGWDQANFGGRWPASVGPNRKIWFN